MSLKNNVVIVTGASSGIGAATAIKFSKVEANVVIVGRNKEKLTAVGEKCGEYGSKPLIIVADLTTDGSVKEIVDITMTHFGKLNVLVNNAGIGGFLDIASENIMEMFDHIMATNLRAPVFLTNLCVPHLIKTKGNIINISSVGAHAVLYPGNFGYCTSKAALNHFTRGIALDLAVYGVRVNSISPGPVKTDYLDVLLPDKALHEKFWSDITKRTALGKLADSEEVADLILYLASEKGNSITGSSFLVDNGTLLKSSF